MTGGDVYKSNKLWFVAGIVTVSDFHVYVAPLKEEWRPLLAHYAGPVAVVVVAALLIVVLPLSGYTDSPLPPASCALSEY
ncbi:hypothetical protein HF086_012131 [Spodoptera exigua]|uniref:Uncharacterized protein n=1 Tax=Spodoptera exigua TaxID=7107 RepID=A0A922MYQ3_SPOEX|nr:hypothetical protein HF086_012131 [Spodoptera exigua]